MGNSPATGNRSSGNWGFLVEFMFGSMESNAQFIHGQFGIDIWHF
jgi:hypothetical protein